MVTVSDTRFICWTCYIAATLYLSKYIYLWDKVRFVCLFSAEFYDAPKTFMPYGVKDTFETVDYMDNKVCMKYMLNCRCSGVNVYCWSTLVAFLLHTNVVLALFVIELGTTCSDCISPDITPRQGKSRTISTMFICTDHSSGDKTNICTSS